MLQITQPFLWDFDHGNHILELTSHICKFIPSVLESNWKAMGVGNLIDPSGDGVSAPLCKS